MTLDEAKGLCYSALAEPIGLVLRTNDITQCRARLHAARRALGPCAEGLQIRASPVPEGDLVIVKREPEIARRISGPEELGL